MTQASSYLRGRALRPGDTIGLAAFSAPSEPSRFLKGVDLLRSKGFQIKIALDPTGDYGKNAFLFASASPLDRARAFEALVTDPEVKAILSVRGAYGSAEMLPLVQWDELRSSAPKPMIGFSDTTAVLLAMVSQLRFVSIHGPSLESSFSKSADNERSRESGEILLRMLQGELVDPFSLMRFSRLMGEGDASGVLIGGNLSLVASLVGTPFLPSLRGAILFLEEIGEKPYRLHRMLLQLKMTGAFEGLAGVVLGSFRNCVHAQGLPPSADDVFRDIFKDYSFPVLQGGSFGHEDYNLPIPLGVPARIVGDQLELAEPAVIK